MTFTEAKTVIETTTTDTALHDFITHVALTYGYVLHANHTYEEDAILISEEGNDELAALLNAAENQWDALTG